MGVIKIKLGDQFLQRVLLLFFGTPGTVSCFHLGHASTSVKNNFHKDNNEFDCFKKASVTVKVFDRHRRMTINIPFPMRRFPLVWSPG